MNPGSNRIERKSDESSVIISDQNIFQPDVIREKIMSKAADATPYCLNGWPSYLMIPKGNRQGAKFILFAMVSNGIDDKVSFELLNVFPGSF